jgi:hypothetical protein
MIFWEDRKIINITTIINIYNINWTKNEIKPNRKMKLSGGKKPVIITNHVNFYKPWSNMKILLFHDFDVIDRSII